MNYLKKNGENIMKIQEKINKVIIKTGTVDDFFANARKMALALDRRETLNGTSTITFEDPHDMFKFLSPKRMEVYAAIKHHPDSITNIAKFIERNRSSVSKDIKELLRAGIVKIDNIVNPGHGRLKIVKLAYPQVVLQASL